MIDFHLETAQQMINDGIALVESPPLTRRVNSRVKFELINRNGKAYASSPDRETAVSNGLKRYYQALQNRTR